MNDSIILLGVFCPQCQGEIYLHEPDEARNRSADAEEEATPTPEYYWLTKPFAYCPTCDEICWQCSAPVHIEWDTEDGCPTIKCKICEYSHPKDDYGERLYETLLRLDAFMPDAWLCRHLWTIWPRCRARANELAGLPLDARPMP